MNPFIDHSQVVTTNMYITLIDFHATTFHNNLNLFFTILHYPFPGNGFITQEL
jgi:hypothetical protein